MTDRQAAATGGLLLAGLAALGYGRRKARPDRDEFERRAVEIEVDG
jgi:hypothetical protein